MYDAIKGYLYKLSRQNVCKLWNLIDKVDYKNDDNFKSFLKIVRARNLDDIYFKLELLK